MLDWTPGAAQLRARISFLRHRFPSDGWPGVSDAELLASAAEWLGTEIGKVRTKEDFKRIKLAAALMNRLDWQQRHRLEQLAPERLTVPGGSAIRLDYREEGPPVLAVKLQEMFGAAETPCVADGRQPVLLHLLSPAGRPLQVTQDLRTFWDDVYPDVKKEMRGRYPKHPWPDDPWNAVPTRKTKARKN